MKLISVLILGLFAIQVQAGVLVGISYSNMNQTLEGATWGNSKSNAEFLDLRLGYIMSSGLSVGAMQSNGVLLGNEDNVRTATGISVGYHGNDLFVEGTFFPIAEVDLDGAARVKDGSGYGISLGYKHNVNSVFFLGAEISQKSFSFKKLESANATNKIKSEIYPMVLLGLHF